MVRYAPSDALVSRRPQPLYRAFLLRSMHKTPAFPIFKSSTWSSWRLASDCRSGRGTALLLGSGFARPGLADQQQKRRLAIALGAAQPPAASSRFARHS